MLKVTGISKAYGDQIVLTDISFNINAGERLVLIGPNGCGKSTLLRILIGMESPDSGHFQLNPSNLKIRYLPQGFLENDALTISEYLDRLCGDLDTLSKRLEDLSRQLLAAPEDPGLQQEYDLTLSKIQAASQNDSQRPAVLAGLNIDRFDSSTSITHLSGGQRARLALAGLILSAPNLLLLDEPTNHLDIGMLDWLENWLLHDRIARRNGILLVSHDRLLLERVATSVLELDPITHQGRLFAGNYSDYLHTRLVENRRSWEAYSEQQEEIARLRSAAQALRHQAAFKRGGKGDSGDKFAKGFFGNRARRKVGLATQIEDKVDKLLTEDRIEKPKQEWQMKLELQASAETSKQVLVLKDLWIGYGSKPVLSAINLHLRYGQHVALIGPNGSGKTTLFRTLAGMLPPLSGEIILGKTTMLGYNSQEQEVLNPELDALETIQMLCTWSDTDIRSYLHKFLFSGDDVFIKIRDLSYGERSRLMLASLAASGANLLLLDEPINHLDIPSRAQFEKSLKSFPGTVIAAVHDRVFISNFADHIWEISDSTIRENYL